jgi:hypothetical protein
MRVKKQFFAMLLAAAIVVTGVPQTTYANGSEEAEQTQNEQQTEGEVSENDGLELYSDSIDPETGYREVDYCEWDGVEPGATITLKAKASEDGSDGALKYKWIKRTYHGTSNTVEEDLKTDGPTYTVENVTTFDYYYCEVTDDTNKIIYYNEFKVYVENHLEVHIVGSRIRNIPYGTTETLSVNATADDDSSLQYQWYVATYNEGSKSPNTRVEIEGANGPSITVTATEHLEYTCYVKDQYDNYVHTIGQEVYPDNGLTASMVGESYRKVSPGDTVVLAVEAQITGSAGNDKLTYTWTECRRGGTKQTIEGADSASYTVENVSVYKSYTCTVKDQYGRYKILYFYVYPDSGITVQRTIDKETVNLGDTVTVTISASVTTGDVNKLTYQWYYYDFEKKKKVLIDGAVQNSFTVENVPVEFEYWCMIVDEFDYAYNTTFTWYTIENLTGCKRPTVSEGDDGSIDNSSGSGDGSADSTDRDTENSNSGSMAGGSENGSGSADSTDRDTENSNGGSMDGDSENGSGSTSNGSDSDNGGSTGSGTGSVAGGGVIIAVPVIVAGSTESSAAESADSTAGNAADDTSSTATGEAVTDNSAETSGSTSKESVVKVTTKNVKATVTVEKSSDGKVVSAAAAATKQAKTDGTKYKVTLTSSEVKKITKAAGTGSVNITLKAVDESGKQKYKVLVNSKNLKSSKKLYLYSYNSKTKTYTKADSKTYKVSASGSISVSIKKKGTYTLVTAAEAKKLKKAKKS